MKAVQSIGIFGAISSTTVSTLSAVEAAAHTVNQATSWAHEEVEALRQDRALKRDVQRDLFRTKYVLEAAQEVAQVHQEAQAAMANANPETKAIYDALLAKHLR